MGLPCFELSASSDFLDSMMRQGCSKATRFMNVLEIEFRLVCDLGYRSGDTGMDAERSKLSE